MILHVYTDGGARGNPGPAGYGVVVSDQNQQILYQESKYLGVQTNNVAEYSALLAAVSWIVKNSSRFSLSKIIFYSDSQLLIRQVEGSYKVKAIHLKPLHSAVTALLSSLTVLYQFKNIPREKNQLADELANLAMDRKL